MKATTKIAGIAALAAIAILAVALVSPVYAPAACNDRADNDGDGFIDYPADPGCTSRKDKNELGTVQCDNGLDDDGDNSTDYPDDTYCTSPAGEFEANPLCGDPPQP